MKKEKFPIKREVSDEKGEVSDKKRGLLQSREVSEKKKRFPRKQRGFLWGKKEVWNGKKGKFKIEKERVLIKERVPIKRDKKRRFRWKKDGFPISR